MIGHIPCAVCITPISCMELGPVSPQGSGVMLVATVRTAAMLASFRVELLSEQQ